jgi:hypothetical protein
MYYQIAGVIKKNIYSLEIEYVDIIFFQICTESVTTDYLMI